MRKHRTSVFFWDSFNILVFLYQIKHTNATSISISENFKSKSYLNPLFYIKQDRKLVMRYTERPAKHPIQMSLKFTDAELFNIHEIYRMILFSTLADI